MSDTKTALGAVLAALGMGADSLRGDDDAFSALVREGSRARAAEAAAIPVDEELDAEEASLREKVDGWVREKADFELREVPLAMPAVFYLTKAIGCVQSALCLARAWKRRAGVAEAAPVLTAHYRCEHCRHEWTETDTGSIDTSGGMCPRCSMPTWPGVVTAGAEGEGECGS